MASFLDGLAIFRYAMQYAQFWFSHIMNTAGATGYYLAAIFSVVVFRFFLFPLIGQAGSDEVRKFRKGK